MTVIGTETIQGQEVTIDCSPRGVFTAKLGEERIGSLSHEYDKLVQAVRRDISKRKVRVEVPLILDDGRKAVAYSRHGSTRDVLFKYDDDGSADSLGGYQRSAFRADTPAPILKEHQELQQRVHDAQRRLREIEDEYHFDVGRAVDQAIAEKIAEQGATDDG